MTSAVPGAAHLLPGERLLVHLVGQHHIGHHNHRVEARVEQLAAETGQHVTWHPVPGGAIIITTKENQ